MRAHLPPERFRYSDLKEAVWNFAAMYFEWRQVRSEESGSSLAVLSPDGTGLLIHTSEGNSIGLGGRRTKRSGCAW